MRNIADALHLVKMVGGGGGGFTADIVPEKN